MYLERALLLNSGPIERASFELPFHSDGRPKPVLIVGGNGAGKTNLLSTIADALMELAAKHYGDVLKPLAAGRHFYRVSGGRSQRVNAKYELAAFRFRSAQQAVHFRTQNGEVPFDEIAKDLEPFGTLNAANKNKDFKKADISSELAEKVFREGAYVYFPSSRNELPFWLNEKALESDPPAQIQPRFTGTLAKPMVIERGIGSLKPWIIELILDASVDATAVVQALFAQGQQGQTGIPQALLAPLNRSKSLHDLNQILRCITLRDNARIIRQDRAAGDRRLQIFFGDELAMPTLDALSAGQGTLLNVFGSTLKMGTQTMPLASAAEAEGIVLIDELDAHLHANLQYEAVPKLVAMFPKVQFIVTCHSPLVPLGTEKQFGADGYQTLEMPSGSPVSAERYSEFQRSFEMFQATKAFEERLKQVAVGGKPLVIGEGQTDPVYLRTAARLLGFDDLLSEVEFTWVGDLDASEKKSSGQGQLKKAVDIYKVTLPLLGRQVLCLFDQKSAEDVKAKPFTDGRLSVRALPLIDDHPHCDDGSENLLPQELFSDDFYETTERLRGTTKTKVRSLRKVEFAEHVCRTGEARHFEAFRPVLEELRAVLVKPAASDPKE
jgi:hypothetical protein